MFTRVVQIEMHLPCIGMGKLADFQIHDDETAQTAVKEYQIDSIPLAANAQPFLPADERKVSAQFQ
jgi:hypothetical protein